MVGSGYLNLTIKLSKQVRLGEKYLTSAKQSGALDVLLVQTSLVAST